MKVSLLNFYPFEVSVKRPRVLAYADVEIEKVMVIRGVKLFESKHGGYFIQMPECVALKSRVLMESIRRAVVDAYKDSVRSSAG